jgi:hypothetical protein
MDVDRVGVQPGTKVLTDAADPIAAARRVVAVGRKGDRLWPVDIAVVIDVMEAVSAQLGPVVCQFRPRQRLDPLLVWDLCCVDCSQVCHLSHGTVVS